MDLTNSLDSMEIVEETPHKPKCSYKLECITPRIMESQPMIETKIYKIWNDLNNNFLVFNSKKDTLYLIDNYEIIFCLNSIRSRISNYNNLTVELFDIFIELNFSCDETIEEVILRYYSYIKIL